LKKETGSPKLRGLRVPRTIPDGTKGEGLVLRQKVFVSLRLRTRRPPTPDPDLRSLARIEAEAETFR